MIEMKTAAAELVFSTFVLLCADEKVIALEAAKQFGQLIGKPGWAHSGLMRGALTMLRGCYVDHWNAYQGGQSVITTDTMHTVWSRLSGAVPTEDAASFAQDLTALSDMLSGPKKGRLGACEQLIAASEPARWLRPRSQRAWANAGSDMGFWSKGALRLKCVAIDDEAPDVKTFVFCAVDGRRFSYDPGQAIQLQPEIGGAIVKRSYTISSSPSRPERIAVTVKRIDGGLVSCWLHESMAVGHELEASGPHGRLTCARVDAEKMLLISAGSGVTPMMSMLRYLQDIRTPVDVVFLNNVRTPADVIFASELAAISATMGQALGLAIVPARRVRGIPWNGPVGRIGEPLLRAIAPDCAEREVFCCGPDGYREQVRQALQAIGHPPSRYHEERFGSPGPTTSPQVVNERLGRAAENASVSRPTCRVTFKKSAATVTCSSGDLLLEVAERNGVDMESACRVGSCGTCRVKTSGGNLKMDEPGALSDNDITNGYVLACSTRVMGDATIDS